MDQSGRTHSLTSAPMMPQFVQTLDRQPKSLCGLEADLELRSHRLNAALEPEHPPGRVMASTYAHVCAWRWTPHSV